MCSRSLFITSQSCCVWACVLKVKQCNNVLPSLAGMQYSGNICWVFPQRCNVPVVQGTFSEHVKQKYFLKNYWQKSCFCVQSLWFDDNKCWSLGKFQSMFPEYSKNIPWISVSKTSQGYPRNIIMLWKYFYEVKKFGKFFCGLSCESFNIGSLFTWNVFLNFIETVFHSE